VPKFIHKLKNNAAFVKFVLLKKINTKVLVDQKNIFDLVMMQFLDDAIIG